jgi:hypothetical protein
MKKYLIILITLLICAAPFCSFAQNKATDAGSIAFKLGSIVDVSIYTGDAYSGDDQATEITVGSGLSRLNFSYFVINNLAVGGYVYFDSLKFKGDNEPSTQFTIGPSVFYYYPVIDNLFINSGVSFEFTTVNLAGYTDSISQLALGFGGGVTYLLTPHLGIYGSITFFIALEAESGGESIPETGFNVIDFDAGLSVFL